MAYGSSNPPKLMVPGMGTAAQLWFYNSSDSCTAVAASGYFANGNALGMKAGDLLISTVTSSYFCIGQVSSVTASSAATVIFGNMVSS